MRTCVTLFAGFGGKTLGAVRCGYKPVLAVEYDDAIAEVYRQNFGPYVMVASVCDVDYRPYAGADLLLASPPCPSFSVANANAGETANDIAVAEAVCRAIREIQPERFLMENVRGYQKSHSFHLIMQTLTELGYWFDTAVYDAADYGVPQNRKRLIVRAVKDAFFSLPLPVKVLKQTGWYEAIEHLIPNLKETRLAEWQVKRLPSELLADSLMGVNGESMPVREKWEPSATIAADHAANKYRAVLIDGDASGDRPPTQRLAHEPATTIKTDGGGRVFRAVLLPPGNASRDLTLREDIYPSPAITTEKSGPFRAIILPDGTVQGGRVVALDTDCVAALQTFPPDFQFSGKRSVDARGIGNAVPVLMAEKFIRTLE